MTILKVTVDDEQVEHIKKLLNDTHVIPIEEEQTGANNENSAAKPESALERIKKIQARYRDKKLFTEIEDPSKLQREIRKEWDRDF